MYIIRRVMLHRPAAVALRIVLLGVCMMLVFLRALGETPRIDSIQLLGANFVLIHFDTEPKRQYELQFINSLPTNAANQWSNLFVVPSSGGPGHYVYPDTPTTPQRFYRLRVTP